MKTTNFGRSGTRHTLLVAAATAMVTLAITFGVLFGSGLLHLPTRQAEVAARGSAVMPFDLEKTQHVFSQQPDGGVQQVIARDPANTAQIGLIRQHLQEEAEKFKRGDFADPASIHGSSMPGLNDLRNSASKIDVAYSELPNGAQIRYITTDETLIMALHHWFQAQVSDHGSHATDQ